MSVYNGVTFSTSATQGSVTGKVSLSVSDMDPIDRIDFLIVVEGSDRQVADPTTAPPDGSPGPWVYEKTVLLDPTNPTTVTPRAYFRDGTTCEADPASLGPMVLGGGTLEVQNGATGAVQTATRLLFPEGVVGDVLTGSETVPLDLDRRYAILQHRHPWIDLDDVPAFASRWPTAAEAGAQPAPPAGYSWVAGSNQNEFITPYGSIRLGPMNNAYAHIYSTLPFYFNQELKVNGSTVWHSGNDGPSSGLNADMLDSQHGSFYLDWVNFNGVPVYATRWPTTDEISAVNLDRLGASSTNGVLDWNDPSNARPGTGPTLLFGDAANGPGGHTYFHTFSLEYATKDATGQITQFAIPYANSITPGLFIRGKYQGVWSTWQKIWTQSNDGSGSGLDADLLDGLHASSFAKGNFTIDQNLRTTDSPTFFGSKVTDWFRNTTDAKGLYNEANNFYWYADSAYGRWISRSVSGIEIRDTSSVVKGYLFFDANGFGLKSSGSWSVRCNPGAVGGALFGDWTITGYAYATRFIDGDDPTYYLDPGATSNLNGATFANLVQILNTSGPGLSFGATTRQMIDLYASGGGHQYGLGVQASTVYFRTDGGYAWFKGGAHVSSPANDPGAGGTVLAKLNSSGDFYARQFIDINDSSRYLDPSGTSQLNILKATELHDQWTDTAAGMYICHIIPRGTFDNTISAPVGTLQAIF